MSHRIERRGRSERSVSVVGRFVTDDPDVERSLEQDDEEASITAQYYDRYRVPHPASLLDELVARADLSGTGRLLDISCGTGRVTFALSKHLAEVIAVDQEDECVSYAGSVADERPGAHIRWFTGRAEDLDIEGQFELVTIGDAFHRLDRRRIAALAMDWHRPGGKIALLWTSSPPGRIRPRQAAAAELVLHWTQVAGSLENIPSNMAEAMTKAPKATVLADAGLEVVGIYEFQVPYVWTLEILAGFAYSTSILSRPASGEQVEAFERDLHDRLLVIHPDGRFENRPGSSMSLLLVPSARGGAVRCRFASGDE